jgi:hypothetical protein
MPRFSALLCLGLLAGGLLCPAHGVRAADLAALEEQMQGLRRQNEQLRSQLDQQQRQLDELARLYAALKAAPVAAATQPAPPVAASAAPAEPRPAPVEAAKVPAQRLGKVHLTGAGAVAFFAGQRNGTFPNEVLRVDEAKLFLEGPLGGGAYFFTEADVFTRDSASANLRAGELYVDFEGVSRLWGREGQLSLRLGRVDIPFGEEYARRDATDNPLVAHSVTDFWGVDEGVEAYGSLGGLQYVLALQNGSNQPANDFTPGKAVTLRVGFDPLPGLHLALSGIRTGRIAQVGDVRGELWFGNDWMRRRTGSLAGEFQAEAVQLDARRTWAGGHVAGSVGRLRYKDNDPSGRPALAANFAVLEGVRQITRPLHVAARFSVVDAPAGFNLPGDGRSPTPAPTEFLWRFSAGLGYRLSSQLLLKGDYSVNRGRWLGGAVREGENQLAVEAAYTF